MEILLKEMLGKRNVRKEEIAEKFSVDRRTYGSWGRGEQMINLEQACNCVVALHCSIDKIVGRPPCNPSEFSDPREAEPHRCYRSCNQERQDRPLETSHDFAGMSQDVAERDVPPTGGAR